MRLSNLLKAVVGAVQLFVLLGAASGQGALEAAPARAPMKLVRTESAQDLVFPSAQRTTIGLQTRGTNENLRVEIVARRHEFMGSYGGNTNWTLRLVEFGIQSKSDTPFSWFCWEGADIHPHDFKVFSSAGGTTYACYTSGHGLSLFRVDATTDSESARTLLLEHQSGPGALPAIRNGVLQDAVGAEPFYGVNALYWTIIVDNVTEAGGEVRVTLHGDKPYPTFTFALRNDKWALVSGAGR